MDERLRSQVAQTLRPVRPLPPPSTRVLVVAPVAVLLLAAAPLVFEFRDLHALGWTWSWGASSTQAIAGLALIAIALRDAVPGRRMPTGLIAASVGTTVLLFTVITAASWGASPMSAADQSRVVGAVCLVSSAITALPAVALSAVLVARAFPLRPGLAGSIAGLGSGVLADAGWRLFCHYSEPGHVVAAHLGAVGCATLAGAVITSAFTKRGT